MIRIVEFLFFFALACTLGSLVFGLTVYFKGGALNAKFGNAAMRWRVTFQMIALMLFVLLLWMKGH
ncbi:MAG: HIG1 domain-containing protein [Pseudomonadota bacterium]